jgi:hypothetical protein
MPRPDGRGRLYVPLSAKFDTRSCTTEVFLEAIQSVIDDALKPWTMKIGKCDSISSYKGECSVSSALFGFLTSIHPVVQSVADHFSAHNNRVFVAGDAGMIVEHIVTTRLTFLKRILIRQKLVKEPTRR